MSAFTIKTRFYGGAFFARANGSQASSTSSERNAVAALLVLFPNTTITMTCKEACALHEPKQYEPTKRNTRLDLPILRQAIPAHELDEAQESWPRRPRQAARRYSPSCLLEVGPIGERDAYERDVVETQAAYDENPSSMNHEDLYAAKCALRRHWPNDKLTNPAAE